MAIFLFLFLVEHGPKREEKSKNSKDKGGNGGIVIKSVQCTERWVMVCDAAKYNNIMVYATTPVTYNHTMNMLECFQTKCLQYYHMCLLVYFVITTSLTLRTYVFPRLQLFGTFNKILLQGISNPYSLMDYGIVVFSYFLPTPLTSVFFSQ